MKKSTYLTFEVHPVMVDDSYSCVVVCFGVQRMYFYDIASLDAMFDIFQQLGLSTSDKLMMYIPRIGNGIVFTRIDGRSRKSEVVEHSDRFVPVFFRMLFDASSDGMMAGVLDFLRTFVLSNSQDNYIRAKSLKFDKLNLPFGQIR